eukprot:TRINITY_DN43_c0_g1_i1.p1 TRINITY_DN43_c0_g1~~TRINITY_DN43_c0_g1_i1.p1  ORF type:complete len:140 (+),score=28.87 TRINITY_DN43_c0_g1_i1:106-525(+)
MGRVRTKTVKKAARIVVEKYYPKLTLDFQTNKQIVDEVIIVQSKKMRNKIAGWVTHLMKRISKGPVRGISLKLQEMERERRENYVPDVSMMENMVAEINVDDTTMDLLKLMDLASMPNLKVVDTPAYNPRGNFANKRLQ